MLGMNRFTGKPMTGTDHIRQSIADILSTPVGTRAMLREYGSDLHELVDRPTNDLFHVELYAAVATALARWEPRFKMTSVILESRTNTGRVVLSIDGTIISTGSTVRLEGITI